MRVLINVEPGSEASISAIKYFTNNFDSFNSADMAIGVLALLEYDYFGYKDFARKIGEILKSSICDEGFVKGYNEIENTCYVINALSWIYGKNDEELLKCVKWLKTNQNEDGGWSKLGGNRYLPILTLINIEECFKVTLFELEEEEIVHNQRIIGTKPSIVSTLPLEGIFTIKSKIKDMIYSGSSKIWICTRFITEFWPDLITLKRENPEVDIRIITIPLNEARSKYIGDGKKFVDIAFESLQRTLGGNLKSSTYIHARFIITDYSVLISSADLSTEQLEKEINMGIWTKDIDTINETVRLYDCLWNTI
jgi:hypothetical protein